MENKEKLLNEHIEELKRDLKDPNSALSRQVVRLTREVVRQYRDIEELEKRIAALEGRVPERQKFVPEDSEHGVIKDTKCCEEGCLNNEVQ